MTRLAPARRGASFLPCAVVLLLAACTTQSATQARQEPTPAAIPRINSLQDDEQPRQASWRGRPFTVVASGRVDAGAGRLERLTLDGRTLRASVATGGGGDALGGEDVFAGAPDRIVDLSLPDLAQIGPPITVRVQGAFISTFDFNGAASARKESVSRPGQCPTVDCLDWSVVASGPGGTERTLASSSEPTSQFSQPQPVVLGSYVVFRDGPADDARLESFALAGGPGRLLDSGAIGDTPLTGDSTSVLYLKGSRGDAKLMRAQVDGSTAPKSIASGDIQLPSQLNGRIAWVTGEVGDQRLVVYEEGGRRTEVLQNLEIYGHRWLTEQDIVAYTPDGLSLIDAAASSTKKRVAPLLLTATLDASAFFDTDTGEGCLTYAVPDEADQLLAVRCLG